MKMELPMPCLGTYHGVTGTLARARLGVLLRGTDPGVGRAYMGVTS